jgi:hypothetical protein
MQRTNNRLFLLYGKGIENNKSNNRNLITQFGYTNHYTNYTTWLLLLNKILELNCLSLQPSVIKCDTLLVGVISYQQ